jgi:dihydropyrimidinase
LLTRPSECCIGVKYGKIQSLAKVFTEDELDGAEIIDAEYVLSESRGANIQLIEYRGAYVMPGGVDAHVHLCQDLKTGNSNTLVAI